MVLLWLYSSSTMYVLHCSCIVRSCWIENRIYWARSSKNNLEFCSVVCYQFKYFRLHRYSVQWSSRDSNVCRLMYSQQRWETLTNNFYSSMNQFHQKNELHKKMMKKKIVKMSHCSTNMLSDQRVDSFKPKRTSHHHHWQTNMHAEASNIR